MVHKYILGYCPHMESLLNMYAWLLALNTGAKLMLNVNFNQ